MGVRKKVIDPIDSHVGRRLALARSMMGISQGFLGEAIGISFQQIQKYENGVNRISASRLAYLAAYLLLPIGWFFEGLSLENEGNQDVGAVVSFLKESGSDQNSRETYNLVRAFYRIKDFQKRRTVIELIKTMEDEAFRE